MAIIIRGKTVCKLCGNVIQEDQNVLSYPEFTYSDIDPLAVFSGGVFHQDCVIQHELKEKLFERFKKIEEGYFSKICVISNEKLNLSNVHHPDNHIYLGHLVDDKSSPLFRYNYCHINKRYFEFWDEKSDFLNYLKELAKLEGYSKVNSLIDQLESPPVKPMYK